MTTRERRHRLKPRPVVSTATRNARLRGATIPGEGPPPPPPWPPEKIRATVLWNGPMVPPPNLDLREFFNLDRIGVSEVYHAISTGDPDHVELTFWLDEITGWYDSQIIGKRGDDLIALATVPPDSVTPGEPFTLGLWTWIGLPPLHGLTVTLYHPYN